jgi:hypothetical protein
MINSSGLVMRGYVVPEPIQAVMTGVKVGVKENHAGTKMLGEVPVFIHHSLPNIVFFSACNFAFRK